MNIDQLETPCLLLNKTILEQNLERMQSRLDSLGVTLRAHGKTAKNIDVINLLQSKHRQSITASTLKEAEYFFENGINNILYAVGIAPNKLPRVAALISKGANLKIVLDSVEQVQFTAQFAAENGTTLSVLIEIDCDDERAGIQVSDSNFVAIAKLIDDASHLEFKGIMTHAGGSYHSQSQTDIIAMAEQERTTAVKGAALLNGAGLDCDIVSIGSTPTAMFGENMQGITEVRAGVFMFSDLVMAGLGVGATEDIALSVLTTVIGKNLDKHWLLVDAGWMAMSRDRGTAGQSVDYAYGQVCDTKGTAQGALMLNRTNQEHGIIECYADKDRFFNDIGMGQLLTIKPNHACATGAMFDRYYVTEDGERVIDIWHRINGW